MSNKHKALEHHALSCCILAIGFARYLNYSQEKAEKLGACALFHDIGLITLSYDILEKVFHHQQMDKETTNIMQQHTTYGRDILASNNADWGAVDVAYCHHERYDGRGYPRGLKGSAIPLFASIISVIATYEALTSSYKNTNPLSSTDALRMIYNEKSNQFDPAIVHSFVRYIGLYPLGTIVQLKTNDIGVVIANNPYMKHLPKVMVLISAALEKVKPRVLNLQEIYKDAHQPSLLIKNALPSGSFGINVAELIKAGIIDINTDKIQK